MLELLAKIGWTQTFFAHKAGVSEQTVGRWCKGEPNELAMAYLRLVARLLL